MAWPWNNADRSGTLAIAFGTDSLAYAHATLDGGCRLRRCGSLPLKGVRPQDVGDRLRSLGLPTRSVVAVLPLADCQLLQVEAPAVPQDELKAAARWSIKELVNEHVDDLTLDVMYAGDDRPRARKNVFVAITANRVIRELVERCETGGLTLAAIDIRETAQRNLQMAAPAASRRDQANALLMRHGNQCLLTISANGELFYTRRLEWEDPVAAAAPRQAAHALAGVPDTQPGLAGDSGFPDLVDYGAELAEPHSDMPRIALEVQRSLDLWDRSWPELPLAPLAVEAGSQGPALAGLLSRQLGLQVDVFDAGAAIAGFTSGIAAGSPADTGGHTARAQVIPLLGALLRQAPHAA